MKNLAATAAIVAVILLCALSTGGQQASTPGITPIPDKKTHRIPVFGFYSVLPDGRVVGFSASTSKEEIDDLEKRIAEGAVELPPGAEVVGWEPVQGAVSLLPRYEERVATIPTTKSKLDALANAVGLLQTQINYMSSDIKYAHARISSQENQDDRLAKVIDGNTALLADDISRATMKANQLDDLKRELDDFRTAACPVLRTARMDEISRMKLDSACRLR